MENGKFHLKEPLLGPQDSVTINIPPASQYNEKQIKTLKFNIRGIECASCAVSVESVLGKLNGIENVVVSPIDGQTVVKYIPGIIDVSCKAIYATWIFILYFFLPVFVLLLRLIIHSLCMKLRGKQ